MHESPLNETVDEVLKDLKDYKRRSLERIIKKSLLGLLFVGSFGLGLYLKPDNKTENEYESTPYNIETIAEGITSMKPEEIITVPEEDKQSEKINPVAEKIKYEEEKKSEEKRTNSYPKYYQHPLSEENSGKIGIIKGKTAQRVDIRQIDLARLSIVKKRGFVYHLPPVKFGDLSYRIVTKDGVKSYSFSSNGISEPIPSEELASRLVPGDIIYSADLVNAKGNFPFTAVKGKLVLNKEKLDNRKEFYTIARL